ncbi:MAG: YigZ family protein [Oscillospiraceae bacterium]|nr:YigZ family protein [Oscillospiraceae bacterium]
MSLKDSYKTVARESQTLLIEKKSKFISNVKPVDNEEDAIAFLNGIRSKYPDASHNVYAYVIDENNIFRYSDDGEPSGTAGMPVLDTIRKAGLVDVIVVVTRYFGGTLLGTGGLVHTYGASAKQGLTESHIVIRKLCNIVSARVDYTLVGKMQYMLASEGYQTEDTVYDNEVTFKICCPIDDTQKLIDELTNLTNGKAVCEITDKKYTDKET